MADQRRRSGIEFTAEVYRSAARERLATARRLYELREYVMCNYVAGLSVECLLRAYIQRRTPEFDSRHDLHALYRASGMVARLTEAQRFRAQAVLNEIAQRWANDHRFRSEAALRRKLKRSRLDRGIRGDFLKENTRRLVDSAGEFVQLGFESWQRS